MKSGLLLLLLALAAQAQPRTTAEVIFSTHPSGARIYWGKKVGPNPVHDGVSGPAPLSVRTYAEVSHYPVVARLDGFADIVRDVRSDELEAPVLLGDFQPNSVRGWLRLWPWLLPTLALVGGLSAAGLLYGQQLRGRKATLERRKLRQVGADRDSLVGTTVGRFQLLELLGQGGMASVYRALPWESEQAEDEVALKLLHHYPAGQDARDRFYREVTICSRLRHPNLVLLYESVEDDNRVGLVMELVRGKTLRDVLQATPRLAFPELVRLAGQLVEGLAYAHEQGVVHRDLKPDNVMLARDGTVKLMDFGIALVSQGARLTATGVAVGTLAYMAPEQLDGREMTARVDQYSLGMLFFEMLAGRPAFADDNASALVLRRLQEEVPDVRTLREDVPEAAALALQRMLQRSPENRYPNVKQAYQAFRTGLL